MNGSTADKKRSSMFGNRVLYALVHGTLGVLIVVIFFSFFFG